MDVQQDNLDTEKDEKIQIVTEAGSNAWPGGLISRKKLLTSIGLAGIALTTGGLLNGRWTSPASASGTLDASQLLSDLTNITDIAKGDALVGVKQPFTGSIARTQHDKNIDIISVKDFGALGNNSGDDTAAIQAAYNFAKSNGATGRVLKFPSGIYPISQLIFDTPQDMRFDMDGAIFSARSTQAFDSVIKIVNGYSFSITGQWSIDGSNRNNYDCGLWLISAPGALEPTKGLLAFANIYNLTVLNARHGVRIGRYDLDARISEINFFGLHTILVPNPVWIGGSQTGASFVGCNLASEPNATFLAADNQVIRMEGGFATVVGGEIVLTNLTNGQTVYLNPSQSSLYQHPYPVLRISGTHIETASPLCVIANPRGMAAPLSRISQFSVSASGGYVSSGMTSPFIDTTGEPSYAGKISVDTSCHFYGEAGALPTGRQIAASPNTIIEVGRTGLEPRFPDWMGGVSGGILRHGLERIGYADNLNGTTATAVVEHILVYKTQLTTGAFSRYRSCYNIANGIFTVPGGGLKSLVIEAACTAPGMTGDIYVKRGSQIVFLGQIINHVAIVRGHFSDLTAGEQITVAIKLTVAATFGVNPSDYVTFTASN